MITAFHLFKELVKEWKKFFKSQTELVEMKLQHMALKKKIKNNDTKSSRYRGQFLKAE